VKKVINHVFEIVGTALAAVANSCAKKKGG
jgi:hypothetical protein